MQTVFSLMLIRAAGLPFDWLKDLSVNWKTQEQALQVGQAGLETSAAQVQKKFDEALSRLEASSLRTAVFNARKLFYKKRKPPGAALIWELNTESGKPGVTPLLRALEAYDVAREQLQSAANTFEENYREALNLSYRALQNIAAAPNFQQGLLFSSHSLLRQLPRFLNKPPESLAKKERQTAMAVLQYASRMLTKTSPMSFFTTVSVQHLSGNKASGPKTSVPHCIVSPNVVLLEAFYTFLLREPAFYRALSVSLNPCIVKTASSKYAWLFNNGAEEGFQEAAANPVLHFIANLLIEKGRQLPFEALQMRLAKEVAADQPALEAYVLELIDIGFLEWELPESGLSPNWCAGLRRFIQTLPNTPLLHATTIVLKTLEGVAEALPDSGVEQGMKTQLAALKQLADYFEQQGISLPPIPVEQLCYADVAQQAAWQLEPAVSTGLLRQLAACWQERKPQALPMQRAALLVFAREHLALGSPMGFLEFCQLYLSQKDNYSTAKARSENSGEAESKIGALLQVYKEEGRWKAVVNGLYPGGGKMYARWLHLFPNRVQAAVLDWQEQAPKAQPFPWSGYFNANFQPETGEGFQVPGGRFRSNNQDAKLHLGNLLVALDKGRPVLLDRLSGQRIVWTDLGLEAPETKPPVIQLLWYLGMPYVSLEALLPADQWKPLPENSQVQFRARYQNRDLILSRASWAVLSDTWKNWLAGGKDDLAFFKYIRSALAGLTVPRRFFARFAGAKPQYFDLDSPVLMALFYKTLRNGTGTLFLTEMLPIPEQTERGRAAELVLEWIV